MKIGMVYIHKSLARLFLKQTDKVPSAMLQKASEEATSGMSHRTYNSEER